MLYGYVSPNGNDTKLLNQMAIHADIRAYNSDNDNDDNETKEKHRNEKKKKGIRTKRP